MQIVGGNPKAALRAEEPLAGRVNSFVGNDPRGWHVGAPTFGRVGFQAVYPGVDLVYYGNQQHLEYDFLVAPHADPKQIHLQFAGAERMQIDSTGDLVVRMQRRELRWQKPIVYQQDAKTVRHAVAAHFHLKRRPNGQADVSFALGRYDTSRPLVIDPVLLYSTYLGGNGGGFLGDQGYKVAVDSAGNAYITGTTSSTDFPVTAGAVQPTNRKQGTTSSTVFVTKLNANGTGLIYSTYLGGGSVDTPRGIAIDSAGDAYIAGYTSSTDFPVTSGALQTVNKKQATTASNAFVTKLNPTGTALVYSTYLGGSTNDEAFGLAIDSASAAYVAGFTSSTDFPTTPGAFQTVNREPSTSGTNAFVSKINPAGSALVYSTYLGGTGASAGNRGGGDGANGIALDSSGSAYVTGYTYSTDFPVTAGVVQPLKSGGTLVANVFVSKLNASGTNLVYSTFVGRNGDNALGIAIDGTGNAYIVGDTFATNFPTTVGAFQRLNKKTSPGFSSNAFVTELNSTGSAFVYSTYLGSVSNGDTGFSVAVDGNGRVYVVGGTNAADFPTTSRAFQTVKSGSVNSFNAFATKLSTASSFPDFNNDGSTDLLIQNASTNQIASWFMNGATWVGGAYFSITPPADYALVGTGDFSGNGATTLVLQSRTTNQIALWYANGTSNATISGGNFVNITPGAGFKVAGVGDFNGDGQSDLVFQNQTTHQVAIWFMNGATFLSGVLLPFTPPAEWSVVGAGDFNKDGFTDLAFQNQNTGQIALWYMRGATYADGTTLTTVPGAGFKVVGVGDYNGDGSADLLFQNQSSNTAAVWYLRNGAFAGGNTLSLTPPPGWKIVGPR